MKKIILIFSALFYTITCFGFTEIAADKNFVYSLNVGTLEAAVVNILSCSEVVTIPQQVTYRGDTYTITEIAYDDFQGGLFDLPDEKFGYYDYDKARSSVKRINIPETVNTIKANAFKGMRRLEMLIIPATVENLHLLWFGFLDDCARLKTITFLGCPTFTDPFSGKTTFFIQGDYVERVKEIIGAPKQTQLLFPERDVYFERRKKIEQLYQNEVRRFNEFLIAEAMPYNQKLKTNPYSLGTGRNIDTICVSMKCEQSFILGFQDSQEQVHQYVFGKNQEAYIQKIHEEYDRLFNKAIADCRKNNSTMFISVYGKEHPEFMEKVDKVYHEYKCKLQRDELFLILYDKSRLPEATCKQDLYQEHTDLYASLEEFSSWYDKGDSILSYDILQRETLQKIQKYMLADGAKINLQNKTNSSVMVINNFLQQLEDTPYYEEGLKSMLHNGKFAKEYSNQQSYFTSLHDFYINYCLSDNYKAELKKRKSAK